MHQPTRHQTFQTLWTWQPSIQAICLQIIMKDACARLTHGYATLGGFERQHVHF